MNRRILLWGIPVCSYLLFFFWYTDFGGPLQPEEMDAFTEKLADNGLPSDRQARVRAFMERDTGRQFLMLNLIDVNEQPPDVAGAEPGESADQLMGRYMEHMYRQLFRRASHPVFFGEAVFSTLDLVGLDGVDGIQNWDAGLLFRYRSRRTFMEVVSHPDTLGRHEFKIAALEKTLAFPTEPVLYLSDPRLLLGLLLLSVTALTDIAVYGRRR